METRASTLTSFALKLLSSLKELTLVFCQTGGDEDWERDYQIRQSYFHDEKPANRPSDADRSHTRHPHQEYSCPSFVWKFCAQPEIRH